MRLLLLLLPRMVVYGKSGLTRSGNVGCQVRALVSFLFFPRMRSYSRPTIPTLSRPYRAVAALRLLPPCKRQLARTCWLRNDKCAQLAEAAANVKRQGNAKATC